MPRSVTIDPNTVLLGLANCCPFRIEGGFDLGFTAAPEHCDTVEVVCQLRDSNDQLIALLEDPPTVVNQQAQTWYLDVLLEDLCADLSGCKVTATFAAPQNGDTAAEISPIAVVGSCRAQQMCNEEGECEEPEPALQAGADATPPAGSPRGPIVIGPRPVQYTRGQQALLLLTGSHAPSLEAAQLLLDVFVTTRYGPVLVGTAQLRSPAPTWTAYVHLSRAIAANEACRVRAVLFETDGDVVAVSQAVTVQV